MPVLRPSRAVILPAESWLITMVPCTQLVQCLRLVGGSPESGKAVDHGSRPGFHFDQAEWKIGEGKKRHSSIKRNVRRTAMEM